MRELQHKGVIHQYTYELCLADGKTIAVMMDGHIPDTGQEAQVAFLYLTNISSIKKIAASLDSNRKLLQNIIDNTIEAVIITNKNGKIIE